MTYSDDPDYKAVKQEFLAEVRKFHAGVGFSLDWQQLCSDLGVLVRPGAKNQHFHFEGKATITYSPLEVANRQLFTGLHELSHHLFASSEACFRDLLEDKYPEDIARGLEEQLCDEAAGIMLIPIIYLIQH